MIFVCIIRKRRLIVQQLYLHPTWEKAISDKDRTLIENIFEQTYHQVDDVIMSPVIRVAFNHKNELLITALVHNFTHHATRFRNRSVYIRCNEYIEEQVFTISELSIPPFTSMPWTFIFQPNPEHKSLDLNEVILEIE